MLRFCTGYRIKVERIDACSLQKLQLFKNMLHGIERSMSYKLSWKDQMKKKSFGNYARVTKRRCQLIAER